MPNGITIRPLGALVQAFRQYGQQLFQPPKDTIENIDPNAWFSPLQPIAPIAPEGVEPRGFQYWAGQNLLWTPRADAEYSASDLKELSRYPLARIAIENVKDSLCKASWQIQIRPEQGESRKAATKRGLGDKDLLALNRFFEKPDREHSWPEWLRPLLEDMLVIDAATILIRRTFSGQIVELPVLRGEMIVRYIDVNGFTPMPPEPAYAQNWWGIPLVNLTTDQLIYKPRNIVPRNTIASQMYGMSPSEQLAPEIEIGRQRLAFVLAYYTEGSIPGVVQIVPRGTPSDKIAEAMLMMNSDLAGQLAARRQWRLVQGFNEPGKPEQIEFTKEPLLADTFDDQHTRRIFYGYGTSPQRIMKMIRTEGQASQEASEIEGLLPYFSWLKSVIDQIIQYKFGRMDYEMVFAALVEPDQVKQSTVVVNYVKEGVLTRNEGRERIGEDASSDPMADQLTITTGQGAVPLGQQIAPKGPEGQGAQPKPGEEVDAQGKPIKKPPKPNGHEAAIEAESKARAIGFAPGSVMVESEPPQVGVILPPVESIIIQKKAAPSARPPIKISPGRLAPNSILARQRLEQELIKRFKTMRRKTVRGMAAALELPHGHIAKASEDKTVKGILDSLAKDWQGIADSADLYLTDAALAGAGIGGLQLDITDEEMLGGINTVAGDWATNRAAELVGMRRLADGSLIVNPNPKWAITDSTREDIRRIIADMFEAEEPTLRDVENRIEQAGTFSDVRASTIARNEIARAQTQGNLESWKQSGLVQKVNWQTSHDHDVVDECDSAEDDNPYDLDDVPDLPLHVNCLCSLVLAQLTNEESEKVEKRKEERRPKPKVEKIPAGVTTKTAFNFYDLR